MADDAKPDQETLSPSGWLHLPFSEHLLTLLLLGLITPGVAGVNLLSKGAYLSGAVVLIAWVGGFGWLSVYAHRRYRIRLWVTVPSAALVLLASVVVFFSP